jgi:hypothetical protein
VPSIADVYITVLPSTAGLADGIVRALREVDPKAREAGQRWAREIQTGMGGGVDVDLKADTAKAKEQIDKATKDAKTTGGDNARHSSPPPDHRPGHRAPSCLMARFLCRERTTAATPYHLSDAWRTDSDAPLCHRLFT